MNLYWLYDLPTWLMAVIIIMTFVIFSLVGLIVHTRFATPPHNPQQHNDLVSYYMSATGAIFGITLGLIAVGTWTTFDSVSGIASDEAVTIAALYRDLSAYPAPVKNDLTAELKEYTRFVIEEAWPMQQKGQIATGGNDRITALQKTLYGFEPVKESEKAIHAEALSEFNKLIEKRRKRQESVDSGLEGSLWYVILFGTLLTLMVSWFYEVNDFRTHVYMTILYSALLGSLIFLIVAMDNPYRGEFSVTPKAYELIYNTLMQGK